jgi:hypothetical protein
MDWVFDAEVFQWRGPAPYFFVETPDDVDVVRIHLSVGA